MTSYTLMTDRVITGAGRIAARAGCCERTIRRHYQAGRLPGAFKAPGRTSPIKIKRSQLDEYVRARGED